MLAKRLGLAAGALVLGAVAVAVPARADAPACEKFNDNGLCILWTGGVGAPAGGSRGGASGGGAVATPANADSSAGSAGDAPKMLSVNGVACLFMRALVPAPPKTDTIWRGHNDGGIYQCLVPGSDVNGDRVLLFWAAGPPPAAPSPPDPRVLARRAMKSMRLKAVNIGIVPEPRPGSIGIIGLPTWMWVAGPGETTWGPITRTASAGGFTVTATARVKKVVWDMGDGTEVVCFSKGTPYADSFGRQPSPDCGHTYTRQGSHVVTATSFWSVTWAGVGESGVIPLDLSQTTNITMGESQVINRGTASSPGEATSATTHFHVVGAACRKYLSGVARFEKISARATLEQLQPLPLRQSETGRKSHGTRTQAAHAVCCLCC